MSRLSADKFLRRLAHGKDPVRISVGGRRKQILLVEPKDLVNFVNELRMKNTRAWVSYCYDCEGLVVEGSYKILFANTDLFVFPDEGIPIPQEHYLVVNVELIRGYKSFNGYVVITGVWASL